MRIFIIPEFLNSGGTRRFFLKLLNLHNKNKFVTGMLINNNQINEEINRIINRKNISLYPLKNRFEIFARPVFAWIADIFLSIKPIINFKPDLIVVSNQRPGNMLGLLLLPFPVLFIMHTYPNTKYFFPLRLFWNIASQLGNQFVTVSKFSADMINKNMGISRSRIEIVYNSFDTKPKQFITKSHIVLTLGHVVNYKNPDAWVNVAQKVIDNISTTVFYWLGDGPMLEEMRQKIKNAKLEYSIIFPGFCDDVQSYYDKAQVYFQPSLLESQGISILDAMACSLPCVATNVGGIPESVQHDKTGWLCSPTDIDGMANSIIELLLNKDLRDQMGRAGRERAQMLFSPQIQSQKILKLYYKINNIK